MGIRRRRKKLTTMLSSMEQRVRNVEMRPISLLTADQVNAAVTIGAITSETPGFYIGSSSPNTYHIVQDAYYYPARLTGKADDLVEIYVQSSLSLSVEDRIEISGIHGTIAEEIDITSNNFTVAETDQSPWTGRESYEHDPTQDQLSGVTIGYSYAVKPETLAPTTWSTRKRLETRASVYSVAIDGYTVTVTTDNDHRFQADDVIYINIDDDSGYHLHSGTAAGTDGFFTVDSVTNNTLTYTLSAGVDTPTGEIFPSVDVYVFPTARNWCANGTTWIDSTNNTTYYWAGLRWAEFTATTTGVGADSVAPSPVSNVAVVSAQSGGYTDDSGNARAKITLSWDAPTTDENDNPLTDLVGYDVWTSYSSTDDWVKSGLIDGSTSFTALDLDPAKTIYFQIYAIDSSLNRSTPTTFNAVSGTFAGTLNPPSAPSCESELGVVTVKWNGLDNTGVNMHQSVRYIDVHVGVSSSFTPSASNKVTSITAAADNYASVYGYNNGSGTIVSFSYGTPYYFKLVAVDSAGNRTSGSLPTSASISQVGADAIEAGAISAKILSGETITATTAGSLYKIELNANYLRAVKKSDSTETFRLNASDGSLLIGSGITNTKIDGNAIEVANLSATNITTGNLSASLITTGTLDASKITVDNLSANVIDGGTLSGVEVYGGSSTRRVRLRENSSASLGVLEFLNDTTVIGTAWATADDGGGLYLSRTSGPSASGEPSANFLRLTNSSFALSAGSGNGASFYGTEGYLSGTVSGSGSQILLSATSSDGYIELQGGAEGGVFIKTAVDDVSSSTAGHVILGASSDVFSTTGNTVGIRFSTTNGTGVFFSNTTSSIVCGRQGNDGPLISFKRSGVTKGSISVAGETVSYNQFMGSHYSEFVAGTEEESLLRGTIVEATGDLVESLYNSQERLSKVKISDTPGSRSVYGVYYTENVLDESEKVNEIPGIKGHLIAAVGASWIRISPDFSVSVGDLIESNGDGCGRIQSDDLIRSSTVAKITSTQVVTTYSDGSYLVPCVLYCG